MKYTFVSGSTKGIGKAIGLKLLREGYFVLFNYANSDTEAEKLRSELEINFKNKFDILKADLSDINKVNDISKEITDILPQVDVLVFNTGLTDRSVYGEIEIENWMKVFNANLNVPFFLMQSLKDNMQKDSSIVYIGSMLGNIPHSVSVAYGVSKSAIHALVQNMVKFLSKDQIRINAIAPGFVDTDWQKDKPDWLREKLQSKIALQRFAEEDEVAELCWHITNNKYLTGQIIQMDGGYCSE